MLPMVLAGPLAGSLGLVVVTSTTMFMFRAFCRNCRVSHNIPRNQYTGKCPECGEGFYKNNVKLRKVALSKTPLAEAKQETGPAIIHPVTPTTPTTLDVLRMRLAKGEISITEYKEILSALGAEENRETQ